MRRPVSDQKISTSLSFTTASLPLSSCTTTTSVFAPKVVPEQYLARMQCADLFLDTRPFGAGTTASDALWAGLPLLTCPGRSFASRMAASVLTAAGLPELIAPDLSAYEELAVALGNDRPRLRALREQLERTRGSCTLFDTPAFVKDLEDTLIGVSQQA